MERKNKKYDDITSPIYNFICSEHYENFARSRSVDSRAGIFLTFMITAFPFYMQIIDLTYMQTLLTQETISFLGILQCLFFFCSIITFLIAFVFLTSVLCCRKIHAFGMYKFENFNLIACEDQDTTINDMNTCIFQELQKIVDRNRYVVDQKAKKFIVALWLCFAFVFLMVLTIILTMFQ